VTRRRLPTRKPTFVPQRTDATTSRGSDRELKAPAIQLGDPLEYRVCRLFSYLGFFSRRGRELYTTGRLETATDLDVLGIRYAEPFRREVQIAECKSRGSRPLDRIFWLGGVRQYVGAHRAFLVRQPTRWTIKDFARKAGVEVLDLPRIDELERTSTIIESFWPGVSDRAFAESHLQEWNQALRRSSPELTELYLVLQGEVRFDNPFGGLNYLLFHARTLTRVLREGRHESEIFAKMLLVETVSQLAVFIMRVAEGAFGFTPDDRHGLVERGMRYGHMEPALADRILNSAHRLASEIVEHHIGQRVQIDRSLFEMPTSPYQSQIDRLVESLIARPREALSLAPITDLLLSEVYLKNRPDSRAKLHTMWSFPDTERREQLVVSFLSVLQEIEALPPDVLQALEATGIAVSALGRTTPTEVQSLGPLFQT